MKSKLIRQLLKIHDIDWKDKKYFNVKGIRFLDPACGKSIYKKIKRSKYLQRELKG